MIEVGTPAEVVATIRALRDEIPAKPRQAWKVLRWADQVKTLREFANSVIDGKITLAEMRKMAGNTRALEQVFGRIDLYMAVGHAKSLQGVRLSFHHYTLYKGQENVSLWSVEQDAKATAWSNWPRELATGKTKEEAIAAFKSRYEALDINAPASKHTTFEIYSQRGAKGYWIGKKVGRNPILLEGPFDDIKAARAYKDANNDKLVEKLEKAKAIPSERKDTNEPRVGVDMRNGQDVTPELFAETFGFRGVEFGNWVEGSKRQKDLNEAFDALMDMAAILNVPPKALSLNGELGLAFGARGKGGINPAKAHYEPGYVVINLTKKDGAGSLGHEWWHALDNYFSRMRGKGGDMMTEALDVSLASRGSEFVEDAKVRKQMVEAFGNVMKAINRTALRARSAKLDERRAKAYWTTGPEMSARAFESFLISKLQDQNASNDYLANIVDEKTWKAAEALGFELDGSYPYPTAGEVPAIRAAFDEFFATVQTRETEKGVALFSRSQEDSALATTARPLSRAALSGVIERVTAQWKGDGQASVTVVARFDDLPAPILRAAEKQGYDNNDKNDRVLGVAFNGRVYLVQENITSEVEAEETLLHERVHQALRGGAGDVASKNLRAALTQLYRKMGGGEGFLKIANQAGVNLKGLRRQVASTQVSERAALTTEELLAEIEGRRAYERLPDKARRVLGEFVGALRAWLREAGFTRIASRLGVNLDAATLADLRYLLKGLRGKAPGTGSGAIRFMRSDGQVTADAEIRALVAQYANEKGVVPSEAEIAAAARQFRETEAAYGGREGFERAKATGKTKLNYRQWVRVRTPNFKRWFGDWENDPASASKVTDPETGEPMVVYHGTPASFNAFDRGAESNFRYGEAENSGGIFFGTSPESVEYYLEGRRGFERGANILPAFVSIRNPASIDDAPRSLAEQARLLHDAEAAGHDGALIGDQVIAFAPGQAKSAIGNQGTFDGANSDIRFSRSQTTGTTGVTRSDLRAAFKRRMPGLSEALDAMLERGEKGQKGGLVMIDSADPLQIARAFAEKTGRSLADAERSVRASIRAWHGSPHRFDRFSTDAMGTGEGAQAYGWGLYFADSREVAETYRNVLSGAINRLLEHNPKSAVLIEDVTSAGDWRVSLMSKQGTARGQTSMGSESLGTDLFPTLEEAIADAKKQGLIPDNVAFAKYEDGRFVPLESLDEVDGYTQIAAYDPGALYQVELAPTEDQYLLWDKPLSEQSETVRTALRKAGLTLSAEDAAEIGRIESSAPKSDNLLDMLGDDSSYRVAQIKKGKFADEYTGGQAYGDLKVDMGDKAASEYLHSIGIRGIKYLDGASRDGSGGTFNYVIFNDADVQILDVKYSRNGAIQGFYDTQSGLQFLIAPNVSAQTAPGVILHEAVHGRQDAQLDAKAMRLIQGRAKEQNRTLRSFFNRVAARMEQAGESDNATEAMLPDEGKLADLMHDATLAQIDADSDVKYVEGDDRDQPKPRDGVYRGLAGSEHVQVGGRHNRAGMFGPSPA